MRKFGITLPGLTIGKAGPTKSSSVRRQDTPGNGFSKQGSIVDGNGKSHLLSIVVDSPFVNRLIIDQINIQPLILNTRKWKDGGPGVRRVGMTSWEARTDGTSSTKVAYLRITAQIVTAKNEVAWSKTFPTSIISSERIKNLPGRFHTGQPNVLVVGSSQVITLKTDLSDEEAAGRLRIQKEAEGVGVGMKVAAVAVTGTAMALLLAGIGLLTGRYKK